MLYIAIALLLLYLITTDVTGFPKRTSRR